MKHCLQLFGCGNERWILVFVATNSSNDANYVNKVIDAEQKGYIEADIMRDLLTTKGTPFREKEMECKLQR